MTQWKSFSIVKRPSPEPLAGDYIVVPNAPQQHNERLLRRFDGENRVYEIHADGSTGLFTGNKCQYIFLRQIDYSGKAVEPEKVVYKAWEEVPKDGTIVRMEINDFSLMYAKIGEAEFKIDNYGVVIYESTHNDLLQNLVATEYQLVVEWR